MNLDKHALLHRQKEIIEAMDIAALRRKFLELYGFETTQPNLDNLRRRILYRLQEVHFGGLTAEEQALFEERADRDPLARLDSAARRQFSESRGTKFTREWKGGTYEVVALGDRRFEHEGAVYRSLTAIAGKITGTHWNGRKFFGVG